MTNAVKKWIVLKLSKKPRKTDDLNLARIRYYVPEPVEDKQIMEIPYGK
jgi:hypothetical protein